MSHSWVRTLLFRRGHYGSKFSHLSNKVQNFDHILFKEYSSINSLPANLEASSGLLFNSASVIHDSRFCSRVRNLSTLVSRWQLTRSFCSNEISKRDSELICSDSGGVAIVKKEKVKLEQPIDYTKIDINLLPTVILVGRPNVGKSALYNRLIRRREALVYNTPDDHVTRDIREGIAKLANLRFRVLDSAGLETEATSGTILHRTASMTANVLARTHFAVFLIDVRAGVHPLDFEVGKWLRKHAPAIKPIVAMNKCESLCDGTGSINEAAEEALTLGFGAPIAISAETGLGMTALYDVLRPPIEDYMLKVLSERCNEQNSDVSTLDDSKKKDELDDSLEKAEEANLPLQLAIVGRPNVGKSTLLNTLLQEERVLVGPEVGLTRDSVRAQFDFEGRTIYLVDTAGWLQRTGQQKGPSSLSIMQSRKNLMRAHVVALVLDAEEIAKARRSMTHAEVVIARRAVEEGRGLVVIVNKMDLLAGRKNSQLLQKVMEAVPLEIQTVIPQITGIPVIFTSALEGRGRLDVLDEVITTYKKWCSRLPTAKLNRWIRKVMSRHSWKDHAAQPKIKYFTQVKARPPTFVAFTTGKTQISDTELRFLTKSLKEDFDLGGIPIRILQRSVAKKTEGSGSNKDSHSFHRKIERDFSDKRSVDS